MTIVMKKLTLYFKYYLSIAILPTVVSLILISTLIEQGFTLIIPAIISKLFIFLMIWFVQWLNYRKKQNLYFYFNQGISQINLYSVTLIIDILLLLILTSISLWIF